MPTRRFLVSPRLFALIARRAAKLRGSPEKYLTKLIRRDIGRAQEKKAIAKLRRK
jgi:hypothetical protein